MKFTMHGTYTEGVADIDPAANPGTILENHILVPKITPVTERTSIPRDPSELWLLLLGSGAETVTLSLYWLLEEQHRVFNVSDYINSSFKWFSFATGIVVTNGVIQKISSNLPAGGVIYARRTADTIGTSLTRSLLGSWIFA